MTSQDGVTRINDDEWYTPMETAATIADWLATTGGLSLTDDCVLCPADLLPDGKESAIPIALRDRGFKNVRVTRDLPMDALFADWREGEVVVTNPPFSLLVAFRQWLYWSRARFCVLSRPGCVRGFPVIETGVSFRSTDGRGVAAAWMQNLADTRRRDASEAAMGNCKYCESEVCTKNIMTGGFTPGEDRDLYGWGQAVNLGVCGAWCQKYIVNGHLSFLRFLMRDLPRNAKDNGFIVE